MLRTFEKQGQKKPPFDLTAILADEDKRLIAILMLVLFNQKADIITIMALGYVLFS